MDHALMRVPSECLSAQNRKMQKVLTKELGEIVGGATALAATDADADADDNAARAEAERLIGRLLSLRADVERSGAEERAHVATLERRLAELAEAILRPPSRVATVVLVHATPAY